jgi:hypothetical protein
MTEHYLCKLKWSWGKTHSFAEETEFYIWDKAELDKRVKEKIVWIARRHAMDCDEPMNVWVIGVSVIPVTEEEFFASYDMGWDEYLKNEVEYTRELTANKKLYTDGGSYNLTVCPKNKI